jgi:hypothetical protein
MVLKRWFCPRLQALGKFRKKPLASKQVMQIKAPEKGLFFTSSEGN